MDTGAKSAIVAVRKSRRIFVMGQVPPSWMSLPLQTPVAGAATTVLTTPYKLHPAQLRPVELALAAAGAVLQRDRHVPLGGRHLAEREVRGRQPELELMIIRVALDLALEEVAGGGVVARLHRRAAAIEEVERRVRLDLRQPLGEGVRLEATPQSLQHQREVG